MQSSLDAPQKLFTWISHVNECLFPQKLFTLSHCLCKCLSRLLTLCFKRSKACSLEMGEVQLLLILLHATCNSWVLSSLGKESTKTCQTDKGSSKHQSSFSPQYPWQSWQPFVQIIGCDLHRQGEAWRPPLDWQAGPCPANQPNSCACLVYPFKCHI